MNTGRLRAARFVRQSKIEITVSARIADHRRVVHVARRRETPVALIAQERVPGPVIEVPVDRARGCIRAAASRCSIVRRVVAERFIAFLASVPRPAGRFRRVRFFEPFDLAERGVGI